MIAPAGQLQLIENSSLQHFFQQSVAQAMQRQSLQADVNTVIYVVNLLTLFARSEHFFAENDEGRHIQPLASHYQAAVNSTTDYARTAALQRLGDIALFVSGVFSHSLERRLVDIDYYINMGGNAYAHAAEIRERRMQHKVLADVLAELSEKFVDFVDVLNEVGEGLQPATDANLLRLYEVWRRSGSRRARALLLKHGIHLDTGATPDQRH